MLAMGLFDFSPAQKRLFDATMLHLPLELFVGMLWHVMMIHDKMKNGWMGLNEQICLDHEKLTLLTGYYRNLHHNYKIELSGRPLIALVFLEFRQFVDLSIVEKL
jgi:hypothetical protein